MGSFNITMCCTGKPCFNSVFGISLRRAVIIIGCIQLGITAVVSIINTVRYAEYRTDLGQDCSSEEICVGPLIKFAVFDGFFGTLCALLLIFGGKSESSCMLVSWLVLTGGCSLNYLYVLLFNDWTDIEDYISLAFLLFYLGVFTIICSYFRQSRSSSGVVHV